jgi:hypothetical protein
MEGFRELLRFWGKRPPKLRYNELCLNIDKNYILESTIVDKNAYPGQTVYITRDGLVTTQQTSAPVGVLLAINSDNKVVIGLNK